ncbi:L,D-transpeptidase [Streptomyces sp. SID13726]|uniref:L,D-transpeptidase family protein n=1 Tax=Streptomyces sp. SID13726 TaxID=2706058 RepID=UPI001941B807|nr:L,D-transpeptidase [Streptomyces sp. SID13726]
MLSLATPVAVARDAAPCTAGTGPYQRELEQHLRLPADGRQTPADCEAIRAFQTRNAVQPADGYAGLATYRTMLVVEARPNPNTAGRCPVRAYRVACVDLDRQLMWVQSGARVVFAPVPIRSGRDGHETRTGDFSVYSREIDHWSDLYDAPMPYAQFFDGGQAFHGTNGDLFGGGSHGCVNLRLDDARRLWDTLAEDDAVHIWGVKPGTERGLTTTAPSGVRTPPPTPGAR